MPLLHRAHDPTSGPSACTPSSAVSAFASSAFDMSPPPPVSTSSYHSSYDQPDLSMATPFGNAYPEPAYAVPGDAQMHPHRMDMYLVSHPPSFPLDGLPLSSFISVPDSHSQLHPLAPDVCGVRRSSFSVRIATGASLSIPSSCFHSLLPSQCHRRNLKCEYPTKSRRGMRKKQLPEDEDFTAGTKIPVAGPNGVFVTCS
ncbi:hypothetical protein B0H13DRAFT_2387986 [Mycena leptocephala]|nr:hypothetical protein B0H13DRAFT_2387986 [Mycena leptocephala]